MQRRKTHEVRVGNLSIGSEFPIRVQSMTTTDTMDTAATIQQSIRMIEVGCELVRITAPSIREAKNLEFIRKGLREAGYSTPLVADIHYTPNAAEIAARLVEKVRVNPGNYVDKNLRKIVDYTDLEYENELHRLSDRFSPLVKICKEYGTAMRIGTNHGSLSDRIMSRYGDTPHGMVESALEFIRIAESLNYYNIVLSMKSSNPLVMIQAYRLLTIRLAEQGLKNYPLHLGVTEAGDGEDGRIKSSVGIGTLLEDGLGDTIRVSLTEEPEAEIPVARHLAERYKHEEVYSAIQTDKANLYLRSHALNEIGGKASRRVGDMGGDNVPRVFSDLQGILISQPADLAMYGHEYSADLDKWTMKDQAVEYFFVGDSPLDFMLPTGTKQVVNYETWLRMDAHLFDVPCFPLEQFLSAEKKHSIMNFVWVDADCSYDDLAAVYSDETVVLVISASEKRFYHEARYFFEKLHHTDSIPPAVIAYQSAITNMEEDLVLHSSTDVGALFADGYGNGVMMSPVNVAYGILQATRKRMSKTEYISCPSCGRTLFDLQETTAMIRNRTDHLKGLKIGIMGCIVNGPGEMADADYGYVGSGPNKITLYRAHDIVKRNVPANDAVEELINIIRGDGRWIEKSSS